MVALTFNPNWYRLPFAIAMPVVQFVAFAICCPVGVVTNDNVTAWLTLLVELATFESRLRPATQDTTPKTKSTVASVLMLNFVPLNLGIPHTEDPRRIHPTKIERRQSLLNSPKISA